MRATAITMMGQRKPGENERRRAMVRLNGMMFYSIGFASFLESTVPLDTSRMIRLAEGHADVRPWLEQVWLPQRAEHGRLFRDYIETTWPEFDWNSAYQEFHDTYCMRSALRVGPPGLALEFLARCVSESSLAVFYRTLGKCADDPELRALARKAALDHVTYFNHFRELYERLRAGKRAGFATTCRTVLASCRSAREVDVAAAFDPLGRHWHGGWVFPALTYPEFLARLAVLLKRHATLGPLERLLFRAWLNPPQKIEPLPRPAKANGGRKGTEAAPVLRAA